MSAAVYGRALLYMEADVSIRGGAGISCGRLERACSGFGVLILRGPTVPWDAGRGDFARGDENDGENAADADGED